jgi:hypothetical protein
MREDEGCAGDVADLAGAGGDVLEGAPAAGEQREPAFAEAAQGSQDRVAGASLGCLSLSVTEVVGGRGDGRGGVLGGGVL